MQFEQTPSVAAEAEGETTPTSVSAFEVVSSLMMMLDFVDQGLIRHHQATCYIALALAQRMGCRGQDLSDVFIAAVLHDIGAISVKERRKLVDFEITAPHAHAELGALLLRRFPPFARAAGIVRHHHVAWPDRADVRENRECLEFGHILHVADRAAILLDNRRPVFSQVAEIREKIDSKRQTLLAPDVVDAFLEVSRKEVFWLDLHFGDIPKIAADFVPDTRLNLDIDGLLGLARFFSLIIDSRSRFTATHSSGVAATAEYLAYLFGFSEAKRQRIKVAGYLHDIGKLAVPDTILEKKGQLTLEEWRIIHAHSYHSRNILAQIDGLRDVAEWAGDHHETLTGSGYPFHKTADDLCLESRIITVADIFTGLSEDRPYRSGLGKEEMRQRLQDLVGRRDIDPDVATMLMSNYQEAWRVRQSAQELERRELSGFWTSADALNVSISEA